MNKLITILVMLVALGSICPKALPATTNAPLTFYIVSKQRIEGGEFFNRFPFPKLGYISSTPDLVVKRLKEVSSLPETSGPAWIDDRTTGSMRKGTIIRVERHFFTLQDDDATRLRRLADKAEGQGQLVLGLLGDKAIVLLRPEEIPAKAQLEVIGNWGRSAVEEIADALKNLVR